MTWNCGTIRDTTSPMQMISAGMETSRINDNGPSSRTAMMTPPIIVIGAAAASVNVMSTRIWTWVTSLVILVINDGAPRVATSWAE